MYRLLKATALLVESVSTYVFIAGMLGVPLFLETSSGARSHALGDLVGYIAGLAIYLLMLVAFQSIAGVKIHKEKSALHHVAKVFEREEPVGIYRVLLGLGSAAFAPVIIWMFWSAYQKGEAPLIALAVPLAGLLAHWVFGPLRSLRAKGSQEPDSAESGSNGPESGSC